jgi:hypothetical protein
MTRLKRYYKIFAFSALTLVLVAVSAIYFYPPKYEVTYLGGGVPLSSLISAHQTHQSHQDSKPQKTKQRSIANAHHHFAEPRRKERVLEIAAGEVAYIDRNIDVDTLVINGQLHCMPSHLARSGSTLEIKARSIHVNGLFQCGTSVTPYAGKLVISLKASDADPETHHDYRGMMVNPGGVLTLTGNSKKAGWVKLDRTAETGDTELLFDQPVDGSEHSEQQWQVGDQIALAPTSYASSEAESFTVTSIQGRTVGLDRPVQYRHWGQVEEIERPSTLMKFILRPLGMQKVKLDQRAEVANLTRNILLRADESVQSISDGEEVGAEIGGHVMVMAGGAAYIDGVEFYRMGQAGILGRYPFHWHIAGNVMGQFIKNSSVHRSFQRCITVHRTDFAVVENNTCYDFKGHGFFLEDGTEKNNQIIHNLGMLGKYPHRSKRLLSSDMTASGSSPMGEYQGRFPNVSVFWLSHPYNDVRGNVAAGSVGTGFWMGFHNEVLDNDGTVLHPVLTNTLNFSDNISHSSLVGFTWDGGPNGPLSGNAANPTDRINEGTTYHPPESPVFRRLTAFKNSYTGIYFKGVNGVFENTLTADNGWHFWVSFNQIIKNSTMVGRSQNHTAYDQNLLDTNFSKNYIQVSTRRTQQSGIALYDGPFELDGIDFLKYPTSLQFRQGSAVDITPVPISMAGGTEAFMNVTQRVRFSPNPVLKVSVPANTNSALIRDLDGSFSGQAGGGVMVGDHSLGVFPNSGCAVNLSNFRNMAVCPSSFHETSFNIFGGEQVWGVNGQTYSMGMWGQPFVARRSDGAITNPVSQWPNIFLYSQPWTANGTKFGLPTSVAHDVELLLKRQRPSIWINSEIPTAAVPLTKLIAQGKNCRLVSKFPGRPEALSVDSVQALRSSTVSAYYSSGEDFYVRLIPNLCAFNQNSNGSARSYKSDQYFVECDEQVDNGVKGRIEEVTSVGMGTNRSLQIRGWACHFNRGFKISTQLGFAPLPGPTLSRWTPVLTTQANQISDPDVSFRCGTGATGFGFQFTLSAAEMERYAGRKILVKGISSIPGQSDAFLERSDRFTVPSVRLRPDRLESSAK